ncbi:MAG: class I SAM-dependent methyltransferase [Planctomycetota bacterium]
MGLLDSPRLYLLAQDLLGARRARRRWLESYAAIRPGQRVLDIGCGPGFVATYLQDVQYVGTDINKGYIDYAMRHHGHLGEFHCCLIDNTTASHFGCFDRVLLAGVLHHIDDAGTDQLFRALTSSLRPGGQIITLDGYRHDSMSFISRWLIDHDRGRFVRGRSGYERLAAPHFKTVRCFYRDDLFRFPYDACIMTCQYDPAPESLANQP